MIIGGVSGAATGAAASCFCLKRDDFNEELTFLE